MTSASTKEFYQEEAQPLLKPLKGPVTTFEVPGEVQDAIKARAVETGRMVDVDFSDIPLFDDITERQARQRAKTAKEVLTIFDQSDAVPHEPSDVAALMHAEGELASASIVEGARLLKLGEPDPRHRRIYEQEIDRGQDVLFGKLDRELAGASMATLLSQASSEAAEAARAEFLEKYPWAAEEKGELMAIHPEKLKSYHDALHERYAPTFYQLRSEMPDVSNANLVQVTQRYLELRGFAAKGWSCQENLDRTGFFVNATKNILECGKRSDEITWDRFEELMMHEVEKHLISVQNARDKGADALASASMPGIADVEEGAGLVMETLWRGRSNASVGRDVFRYMAIAYADGLYDGVRHNEDESYQFIWEAMRFNSIANGKPDNDATVRAARSGAYDHIYRAFRGMPRDENGDRKVLRRNAGYLLGSQKLITLINESDADPAKVIEFLQQGKIDPTNNGYNRLLQAYGLETL
jgi:hypothetical protein